VSDVATCIGCGCDDRHACEGGCWWLRVDYDEGKGVCNQCEEHVEAWDRGDRTSHAAPVAEIEAFAAGELRIHRPDQKPKSGGCNTDHDWPYEDAQDGDTCRQCGMTFLRHVFTEMP
jgi:hypothetical protein